MGGKVGQRSGPVVWLVMVLAAARGLRQLVGGQMEDKIGQDLGPAVLVGGGADGDHSQVDDRLPAGQQRQGQPSDATSRACSADLRRCSRLGSPTAAGGAARAEGVSVGGCLLLRGVFEQPPLHGHDPPVSRSGWRRYGSALHFSFWCAATINPRDPLKPPEIYESGYRAERGGIGL